MKFVFKALFMIEIYVSRINQVCYRSTDIQNSVISFVW